MNNLKFKIAKLLEDVIGRRNLVRTGRFLLDYARRDLPNNIVSNGEWMVQETILKYSATPKMVIVDVGANVGLWSQHILELANSNNHDVELHAFEPSYLTFQKLVENLSPFQGDNIHLINSAISDKDGSGTLFKPHELAGSNSLYEVEQENHNLTKETIKLERLDDYCSRQGVTYIDLLKLDVEGHDFIVLDSIKDLMANHIIQVVQFEYNHRWISSRHFLRDVFELLIPIGYRIGKVTPNAIEWYENWSSELETFREANYIGALKEPEMWFSSMKWWNANSNS